MKKLLSFIGASFLIALTTAVAYASIPAPNGTINGCYTTQTVNGVHVLGVVDSTGVCPTGTISLNWNQTGPQGATGPQGPAGFPNSNSISVNTTQTIPVESGNYQTEVGWVSVAGGSSFTLTLPTQSRVLITSQVLLGTRSGIDEARYLIDGSEILDPTGDPDLFTDQLYTPNSSTTYTYATVLAAGTHTFTFQVKAYVAGGGPTTYPLYQAVLVIIDLG